MTSGSSSKTTSASSPSSPRQDPLVRRSDMRISYRWLKEYVETDLSAPAVADRLINAGIEVAGVVPLVTGLSGVVVGEVEAIEKEVGATASGHRLVLCRVATSRSEEHTSELQSP